MKTHDFYYELPPELIAQTPLERRDASRLLTLDKDTGAWTHRHFHDLPSLLRPAKISMLIDLLSHRNTPAKPPSNGTTALLNTLLDTRLPSLPIIGFAL